MAELLHAGRPQGKKQVMNALTSLLIKLGLLKEDLDYHLLRTSMVIIFLAFGYQKWFEYEPQVLIRYISNGPLIFWMYPVFGSRGASWFLGVSEWLIAALLFLGFWDKKLGILGAVGSFITFVSTVTIIPFMPNGWDPAAGFPAMAGRQAAGLAFGAIGAADCRRRASLDRRLLPQHRLSAQQERDLERQGRASGASRCAIRRGDRSGHDRHGERCQAQARHGQPRDRGASAQFQDDRRRVDHG